MWSPRKDREAEVRRTIMERQAEQQKLNKAKRKQEMEDAKIQKQFELEQRRDERERLKKEREKEKAQKAAERERQKTDKEAAKACHATQKLKRKAPQVPYPMIKRQKQSGGGASKVAVPEAEPLPLPRITSRGRNVTLPSKARA
jgi:hypothetical protein